MACLFGGLDLTDVTAEIDCCTLTFTGSDNRIFYMFDLNNSLVISPNDSSNIIIKDSAGSYLSITEDQLTRTGTSSSAIIQAIKDCRCGANSAQPLELEGCESANLGFFCDNKGATPRLVSIEAIKDINTGDFITYRLHVPDSTTPPSDIPNLEFYTPWAGSDCSDALSVTKEAAFHNDFCNDTEGSVLTITQSEILALSGGNSIDTLFVLSQPDNKGEIKVKRGLTETKLFAGSGVPLTEKDGVCLDSDFSIEIDYCACARLSWSLFD